MSYEPSDAKDLFLQAVELTSPQERSAFLDRACSGNAELRARVEQLLRSHEKPDSFLGQPAQADLTATVQHDGQAGCGDEPSRRSRTSDTGPSSASVPLDFLEPCSTPGRIGSLGFYEIIEVIGRGGMGIVFKAYDTKLRRVVAIKSLAPTLALNATATKRFLREARAAAAVSHDHVVTIFAVEESCVPPYLVMECIAGQSLQQKIDQRGPLETAEILRIGLQMAEGLAAAHRQGLIHRDIKPSNILLENGVERVTITDFGLARAVDDITITQTGHVSGTPEYMSPEQAKGQQLDARSDLFSLGSVLYTMCTGRTAFRADSTVAVLRRVCDDAPRPISEVNSAIPVVLIAIINKLMAKHPGDRFQSAAEVSKLLSEALAWSQQPEGRTPPHIPHLQPRKRPGWRRAMRYPIYFVIAIIVVWVLLFPAFRLLVSNQAQIKFYQNDGDCMVDLFQNGELVATQIGYGRINVPAGTYKFRVREKPDLRLYHFLFEQRTWWFRRNRATLMSPPQALALDRGDQLTVWLSFVVDTGHTETPTDDSGRGDTTNTDPALASVPSNELQAQHLQDAWAQHVGVPVDFQDPLGIQFRLIPPGTFLMGNPPEEMNAQLRELEFNGAGEFDKFVVQSTVPQHQVRLNHPFYLARHEVTVAQFRTFVDETGYRSTMEAVASPPFTWKALVPHNDPDQRPVVGVSWEDAKAFCRWLSRRHQIKYELPSEAQWEYACRAGSAGRWSFGDDTIFLSEHAVCEQDPDASPAPIGGKRSNAFGLFDMHGNVDEWCLDWHMKDFYGRSPLDDPVCLESVADPASGRVVRGGSWDRAAWWTRVTSRSYDFAGLPVRRHGFRLAIVADLKTIPVVKPASRSAEGVVPLIQLKSQLTIDPDDLCFLQASEQTGWIVVSDKEANAVFLFDEDGRQLDMAEIPRPGNIDTRNHFGLEEEDGIPLIVVNQREPDPQLRAMTVTYDNGKPRLRVLKTNMPSGPNYGGCLYLGRDRRMYFFSTTEGGLVQQFHVRAEGETVTCDRVRYWNSPICEGAVADDAHHVVFLAEEKVGIRKVGAEPSDPVPGELILRIGEHGVTGDIEGITLLPTGSDTGYLIASDQNRNLFIVLDRKAPHRFLGEFSVRGSRHTDGVDVASFSLGRKFPAGAFGCHSDAETASCILLVPLPDVRRRLEQM